MCVCVCVCVLIKYMFVLACNTRRSCRVLNSLSVAYYPEGHQSIDNGSGVSILVKWLSVQLLHTQSYMYM